MPRTSAAIPLHVSAGYAVGQWHQIGISPMQALRVGVDAHFSMCQTSIKYVSSSAECTTFMETSRKITSAILSQAVGPTLESRITRILHRPGNRVHARNNPFLCTRILVDELVRSKVTSPVNGRNSDNARWSRSRSKLTSPTDLPHSGYTTTSARQTIICIWMCSQSISTRESVSYSQLFA